MRYSRPTSPRPDSCLFHFYGNSRFHRNEGGREYGGEGRGGKWRVCEIALARVNGDPRGASERRRPTKDACLVTRAFPENGHPRRDARNARGERARVFRPFAATGERGGRSERRGGGTRNLKTRALRDANALEIIMSVYETLNSYEQFLNVAM